MTTTLINEAPAETSADPIVATARDLAHTIGRRHERAVAPHHVSLAFTVAELSRSAGSELAWSPDDPTVVLLRALSNLAVDAPDAVSREGARLLAALG